MKKELKSSEKSVKKISELHLAKLQESNQKLEAAQKQASDIYIREFELKQDKKALDKYMSEFISQRQKLIGELTEKYGKVNINPITGEFVEIDG